MTQSAWDKIMDGCPAMKQLIEDKINEEVGKKDIEIQQLNGTIDMLTLQILEGGLA